MSRVFVTIPNTHWIHVSVVRTALLLSHEKRHFVNIRMPHKRPYVNSLHHIVNEFIESDCDYWLNIDSDNPPGKNPLDLVELDLDIVGFPTPIWHFKNEGTGERPFYYNVYDYDESVDAYREHKVWNGLQQVDAVGTGCVLLARRVFEDPEMRKAPFMREWNEDGTVEKGNDLAFALRARARGWKFYAHYGYPCDHFSELSLREMSRAFQEFFEAVQKQQSAE